MQKMQEHFSAGRENAVEASEVDPWLGHQGSQSRDKVQRLENDMCGAVTEWGLQLIAHLAGGCQGEASFRYGGPGDVSTEPLQLLALMSVGGHASV